MKKKTNLSDSTIKSFILTRQNIPATQTTKLKNLNVSVSMVMTMRTKETIKNEEKEITGDILEQEGTEAPMQEIDF